MYSIINYSDNNRLDDLVRSKKIIPYIIFPNEKYKRGQWYYSYYQDHLFKVLESKYKNSVLEYIYTRDDNGFYSWLVTELCDQDYLIEKDTNKIYKENIINSDKAYTGAQIVYWFFINNIDCFNEKYKNFWKFVDRYSSFRISDYNKYYIKGQLDNKGNYIRCKLIKVKETENITEEDIKRDNEFMKNTIEKDRKNFRKLHEGVEVNVFVSGSK